MDMVRLYLSAFYLSVHAVSSSSLQVAVYSQNWIVAYGKMFSCEPESSKAENEIN